MNYQPFLNMNVMISDQLLLELQQQKFLIAFLSFAIFFCLYLFAVSLNDFIRHMMRAPKRNYPTHKVSIHE